MKTVFGIVCDELSLASATTVEQGDLGPELRHRAWATPASEVRAEQAEKITIDRDHDRIEIGQVVYLERRNGSLWAVGQVRDDVSPVVNVRVGSALVALETDFYWSASRLSTEDYRDIVIDSISLTASPARVGARPVAFLPGGLDYRTVPRERWHLHGLEGELLTRAAASHLERRGSRRPLIVHDGQRRDDLDLRSHPALIAQTLEEQWAQGRPPGRLRHSQPRRGSVLAVR